MKRRTRTALLRSCLAVAPIPAFVVVHRMLDHGGIADIAWEPLFHAARRLVGFCLDGLGQGLLAATLAHNELRALRSSSMRAVHALIPKIARTSATVLLRGETGVGKEVVARAIHEASARASKPFIRVNCAAVPDELLESELFGHERGSFTGAHRTHPGRFEVAHGGTLLLDEVGELGLEAQAKLLHVLDTKSFTRVGGTRTLTADVHVIAATNRDLEAAVAAREFRADLYYRLKVIEVAIPPLRDRREDIPLLLERLAERLGAEYERPITLEPDVVQRLVEYHWPGNVRQLENVIRRMIVLGDQHAVCDEVLTSAPARRTAVPAAPPASPSLGLKDVARRAARDAERAAIRSTLDRVQWNRVKAARLLGISYSALLYKIAACGLHAPDQRANGEHAA